MSAKKPPPFRKRGATYRTNTTSLPHPIEKRLLELGKNKKWLAGEVKVTEQTIGNICARRSRLYPSSMIAINIMKALGIHEDYLYGIYRS